MLSRRVALFASPALLAVTTLTAMAGTEPLPLPSDAVAVNEDLARCEGDANGADKGTGHVPVSLSDVNGRALERAIERATPVLRFADLSDTHVIDDDGPDAANGTVTEVVLDPAMGNTSATFLNEEFTDEVLDAMIRRINGCNATAPLSLTITTGDITDTNWLNVGRRVIDNIDGVAGQATAFEAYCGYTTTPSTTDPADVDPEACPIPAELLAIPTGRLASDGQQPDGPNGGPDVENDATYQWNTTRALRQALESAATGAANGSSNIAAGFPEGFENARLTTPFYAAFGNHDAIVKGTVTYQAPMGPALTGFGRYFLESKREFINEWFYTSSTTLTGETGHGFNHVDEARWNDPDDNNDGYYSFEVPMAGHGAARFIVLDTTYTGADKDLHGRGEDATAGQTGGLVTGGEVTNPTGLEAGWVDQAQYDWLAGELAAAAAGQQPVLVFSHHPDRTFVERSYSADAARVEVTAVQIDELLGKASHAGAPSTVVGWVAGHTHANRVNPCRPGDCPIGGGAPDEATIERGFWRFETASLIDWPQEGRIVELFDLNDLDADGIADNKNKPAQYALRLTMISPDQGAHDGIAGRSRTLSGYEAMCSMAGMAGGSIASSGASPEVFASNLAAQEFCPERDKVAIGPGTPAGALTDRDVLLLP